MSKSIKAIVTLSFVAIVAACGSVEEEIVIEEPIVEEQTFDKF